MIWVIARVCTGVSPGKLRLKEQSASLQMGRKAVLEQQDFSSQLWLLAPSVYDSFSGEVLGATGRQKKIRLKRAVIPV